MVDRFALLRGGAGSLFKGYLYDGPTGQRTQKQQSYTFDSFGNLTNITTGYGYDVGPTARAAQDFAKIKQWYKENRNRLCWNGNTESVELCRN